MDYTHWKILKTELEEKQEEYAEVASWCNEGQEYHIEDDGTYYKTVINPPAPEPTTEQKIAKLKERLTDVDEKSARSLRAIVAGTATEEDRTFLANLEAQAEELRRQIKELQES